MGIPTNGRQCYKVLSADKPENFDLPPQTTRFYSIPPRYTNVDIRLTVESHRMALDIWVLMSSAELTVEVRSVSNSQLFLENQFLHTSKVCSFTFSLAAWYFGSGY